MTVKKILLAGGSGLIGQRLSDILIEKGYHVHILSRSSRTNSKHKSYFLWDIEEGKIDASAFDVDAVVNLTGAGIADQRWTAKRKQEIIDSRVKSTALIQQTIDTQKKKPKTYIGASAIGIYGNDSSKVYHETDVEEFAGFMPKVCRLWEEAHLKIQDSVKNTSVLRIGIVLSTKGGALKEILKPMKYSGLGTYFGNGSMIYSWIHIDDICQMFIDLIEQKLIAGIYNGVAPDPVSNKKLTNTITKVTRSLGFSLPVPSMALKFIFGEMSNTILNSTNVSAQKIQKEGFEFKFPEIRDAIQDLITRKI